jgi:hypothetical protein
MEIDESFLDPVVVLLDDRICGLCPTVDLAP